MLPPPSLSQLGNIDGVIDGVDAILVELGGIDLDTRTTIMQMQPKAREQLLQGLKEEGPEGYRRFIREYFRQLTKARANVK